jgi:GGDEF domain-containing protein
MSAEPRPLHVVIVSEDISLLHELSWVLDAVGYVVHTCNDFNDDALWRRYPVADVLIVDGRQVAEPKAGTLAHDAESPLYRIFLYDSTRPVDAAAWFAAGAHDALRTPVSRGELLARLRTGARFLEFERRRQARSSRCDVPGVYSRRGFIHQLQLRADEDARPGATQHALLLASIDWFDGIRRKCGESAALGLVNRAARAIQRATGDNAVTAYLDDGCFAALLTGNGPPAAKNTAEALAREFAARDSHAEPAPRSTLTCAVVPWSFDGAQDRRLNEALETLMLARASGGDCVVLQGEYEQEFAAWREELSAGNPFADVVAQDIMEPFPAMLTRETDDRELAAALDRSRVPVQPYVDHSGRLVGVAGACHGDEPLAAPETIAHDASFADIYEAFSTRGCSNLIVTADERPLGYLSCDGFLSLIDPLHDQSFAATGRPIDELAHLVVPSVCGAAEPDPASAASAP